MYKRLNTKLIYKLISDDLGTLEMIIDVERDTLTKEELKWFRDKLNQIYSQVDELLTVVESEGK
jgi:hypothetical protein